MVSGSSNSRFTLTRLSAFVSMALRFPKATYSLIGLELLVGVEGVDDDRRENGYSCTHTLCTFFRSLRALLAAS